MHRVALRQQLLRRCIADALGGSRDRDVQAERHHEEGEHRAYTYMWSTTAPTPAIGAELATER